MSEQLGLWGEDGGQAFGQVNVGAVDAEDLRKKAPGRAAGPLKTPMRLLNRDERLRRFAQLSAIGMKSKQIMVAMGLKHSRSVRTIRQEAMAAGYVQKLQDERDEVAKDIRAEIKEVAAKCVEYMDVTSALALRNLYSDIEKETPDKPAKVNIAESKLITEMLNSTEYSGKKLEPPKVEVNILSQSQTNIATAAERIDAILAKYLPVEEVQVESAESVAG